MREGQARLALSPIVGAPRYGGEVAVAMLPDMLRRDRERWGMSVGETGA
jgi:hypothetical protein